jgi:hydrogenase nickel incorporation protein HypB
MTVQTVPVGRDLLAEQKQLAAQFRAAMTARGTLVARLIASPGAGKTTLLAATANALQGRLRVAALVGDIATDRDAQRLAPFAPAVQLTTGGACHLEIPLVLRGYEQLAAGPLDILFIEDVGNLVCPAAHDLGEHVRVCLLSVAEGDDKPAKYPKAFRTSQVLIVTKLDLLPHAPFSLERATQDARAIQPEIAIVPLSCQSGVGLDRWIQYLVDARGTLATVR